MQAISSLRSGEGGVRTVYRMDFIDFYCSGATFAKHGNPYVTDDYDRCGGKLASVRPKLSAHLPPAPVPSYDVAFFALFAKLPFVTSASVWLVLSFIAFLATIPIVARVSGLPPLLVFAALALQLRSALQWGQLPPIVMCALAVGAFAIVRRRWTTAAIALTCSMIEPHIGFAACLASVVWIPKIRIPLVIGLGTLSIVGLVALGLDNNLLYVQKILPLQILAEEPAQNQMSLTWLLYWFGASAGLATRLGSLSYLVMLVLGVVFARSSARALRTDAAIPLVPTGLVVLGGPFIHLVQIEVAVICALLFAGRAERYRGLAWCAVIGFSVIWSSEPWLSHPWSLSRLESLVIAAAIAAYAFGRGVPARMLAVGAVAALAYIVVTTALLHVSQTPIRIAQSSSAYSAELGTNDRYTTGIWGVDIRQRDNTRISSYVTLFSKAPPWISLIALLVAIAATTRGQSMKGRVSP